MEKLIIYEVNLSVKTEIIKEFQTWLDQHVKEMLEIEGFVSAQVFQVEVENIDRVELVTHYQLESRKSLQNYFDVHADRMRQDGLARFTDQFSASRRILI